MNNSLERSIIEALNAVEPTDEHLSTVIKCLEKALRVLRHRDLVVATENGEAKLRVDYYTRKKNDLPMLLQQKVIDEMTYNNAKNELEAKIAEAQGKLKSLDL